MMFETTSTTHSPDRPKPHRQRGGVCSLAEPFTGESHSSFARLRLAAPDIRRTCSRDTHTSSRPVPSVSFFASVRSSPYGRGAHGADRTVLGAPGCRSAIQRTRATRMKDGTNHRRACISHTTRFAFAPSTEYPIEGAFRGKEARTHATQPVMSIYGQIRCSPARRVYAVTSQLELPIASLQRPIG